LDERQLFSGDINLIPGIPETDPLIEPSPESHYVGKLTWNPSERLFVPLTDKNLRHSVFSYVGEKTRPQYGYEALLQQVISSRPDVGFYVVGERNRYDSRAIGDRILQGSVMIDDYIPALAAMEDVDVVLTHGGHETAMAALSHDRPLICIGPYQTDCSSTFAEIAYQGAGLLLNHSNQPLTQRKAPDLGDDIDVFGYWHTELSADRIGSSIDEVLSNPKYSINAARLGRSIRSLGGASLALDIIESNVL
jgi:UDP:flavonoid glycosyltransferase YjiC (YdhE family)